jgi:transcriptional regulator with XRE-family HTH domain
LSYGGREMPLRERIQRRLEELGINPFEAARRGGLERGFVNDILIGRKQSARGPNLAKLAAALDVDLAYLAEDQDEPRRAPLKPPADPDHLTLIGTAETGKFVPETPGSGSHPPAEPAPIAPDPRFPAEHQFALRVRGNGAEEVGITEGQIVSAVALQDLPPEEIRDGTLCIVRRREEGVGTELSIRAIRMSLAGISLVAPSTSPYPAIPFPQNGERGGGEGSVQIIGVVRQAVKVFGRD